jgi:signal transduction histidine kinase
MTEIRTKEVAIPDEIFNKWQSIVDIIGKIIQVPAALIMKVEPPYIKVFRASESIGNPYKIGAKDHLPGLYCETVIKTNNKLLVPNALKDPHWDRNPDIKLGMISYLGFPLLWPDGDVFGTICVLDSKENSYTSLCESFMLQFKELVESQLALITQTEDLKTAKRNLQAINAELEAFTYSVSHDLRAPLRHIAGFSQLLLEKHSAQLSDDAHHYLTRICDDTRHMEQLVGDLLNLAHVGRQELHRQVTGLNSLVEEVLRDLQPEVEGRKIKWQIRQLPFVDCDPVLMKQVFSNLLSNAVKFTRPREQAVIEVGRITTEDQPVTFVRDNGVGFSMKYAEKLFSVFERLHRQEDFEGAGVGLATVQRIIHKHGGRVWAEAELNKGATFHFTLGGR